MKNLERTYPRIKHSKLTMVISNTVFTAIMAVGAAIMVIPQELTNIL